MGTNQFRGSGFEYFGMTRSTRQILAPVVNGAKEKGRCATTCSAAPSAARLRKERTFFFASYEGSRRRTGVTRTMTVPTQLERLGDFSQTRDARGVLVPIYDPATTVGGARTEFPGNAIPQNRLDPVGLRIAAMYPLPNRTPDNPSGANNFSANGTQRLIRDNYMVKIEHTLTRNQKLTGLYLYNSDNTEETSVFAEPAADTYMDALRHQNFFYVGYTSTFGTSLINEARYTYSNRINHTISPGLGGGWPTILGLRGVSDDAFPRITVAGHQDDGRGDHERRSCHQQHIRQHVSYVRGRTP